MAEPLAPAHAADPQPAPVRVPGVLRRLFGGWRLNVLLFLLTVATTWLVGGAAYSAALLSILFAHEMGHWTAARHYRVKSTLPYFIPLPFAFGTLGAVIRMQDEIPNRRALIVIGASGPLAGLAVAVPLLFVGLSLSQVAPPAGPVPGVTDFGLIGLFREGLLETSAPIVFTVEGNSPLYWLAKHLVFDIPAGHDVWIHPVALAAWIGLFVTALNMLPAAQLDGGHVVYGLFGEKAHALDNVVRGILLGLGLTLWAGWLVVFVLVTVLLRASGGKHPPVRHAEETLPRGVRWTGMAALAALALTFVPVPMRTSAIGVDEARALPAETRRATGLCDPRLDWYEAYEAGADVGPLPECSGD